MLWVCALPAGAQLSIPLSYMVDSDLDALPDDALGWHSATGDFNGDGFDDLAVGARQATVQGAVFAGEVRIFFGSSEGLSAVPDRVLSQLDGTPASDCDEPESGDRFGSALAAGDFDFDGRDDLAVGAPREDIELAGGGSTDRNGVVQIFLGQPDSTFVPSNCLSYGRGGLPGDSNGFTDFGHALAVGDFQSDQFDDLAIGAPGALIAGQGNGSVTVLHGLASGSFDPGAAQLWTLDSPGVPMDPDFSDDFGFSLATGDLILGLEVACDLVIGSPGRHLTELDQGMVTVLYGCTAEGLSSDDSHQFTPEDFGGGNQMGRMGEAIAIGNYDCSGGDDLAVGVPLFDSGLNDSGEVWVAFGDLDSVPEFTTISRHDIDGFSLSGGQFGKSLASLPAASGCDHLLVGEPGVGFGGSLIDGSVFLIPTMPGVGPVSNRGVAYLPETLQPRAALGISLSIGRFDGEFDHLAVGAPRWDVNGATDAGSVWILPVGPFFLDDFESGDLSAWSLVVGDL